MGEYFAYDYYGAPFQFFGIPQIIMLTLLVLLNIFLLRDRKKGESTRKRTRWTIAVIIWVNELAIHMWHLYFGSWNMQEHLPLHVCSILIWLAGYMLINKDERIYEFAYFIGIAGPLYA